MVRVCIEFFIILVGSISGFNIINKYVPNISHNTTILLISDTLWYQLHVSVTILAIVRLYSNLLR